MGGVLPLFETLGNTAIFRKYEQMQLIQEQSVNTFPFGSGIAKTHTCLM